MSRLFYLIGKSACGKDSFFIRLLEELDLSRFVLYTTRPMRSGEEEGVEYHFTSMETFRALETAGKVIEYRDYNTIHGHWIYYTVDEGRLTKDSSEDWLGIGTLESYLRLAEYYGPDRVVPLYIEVDDGIRLARALSREQKQAEPHYAEMCRRYLADDKDFSEDKLAEAGIVKRFLNDDFEICLDELRRYIVDRMSPDRF